MTKERVLWVDVARGIGILLVILGHTLSNASDKVFIYAFHVPLFFFLSGLFFQPMGTWDQIKKSFRTLFIPYVVFAVLTYAFSRLSAAPHDVSWAHAFYQIKHILYANGTNDGLGFNVVLWFLPCLFAIRIIFTYLYNRICHSEPKVKNLILSTNVKLGFIILLSSFLGYYLVTYTSLKLPFMGEVVPTGLVFYGLGYLFWAHKETLIPLIRTYMLTIIGTSLFLYVNFAWFNFTQSGRTIDMFNGYLNNYVLFYGGALTGILLCICLSMLTEKISLLSYVGKKSLVLLAWHLVLFVYMNMLFHAVFPDPIYNQLGTFGRGILATILVTTFILFINWLWEENKKYITSKS